jgi:signal transduction histidine kinase
VRVIDVRRVRERWRDADVVLRDLPVAVVLTALSLWAGDAGTRIGTMASRPFDGWAVVAVGLECLPLAVRRRRPTVAIALATLGFVLDQAFAFHTLGGTAYAFALFSAGLYVQRARWSVVAGLCAAFVVLAVVLHRRGAPESAGEWGIFLVLLATPWCAGAWTRSVWAAEAARRRRIVVDTRAAERRSIALELHDVVSHHVTAMVVQAEAARHLAGTPERLERTLTLAAAAGRQALADCDRLVGVLDGEAGTPGFRLLAERAREAGQPVRFAETGTPSAPAAVAHRVVQEALTNALKHAYGCPTVIRISHGENGTEIEISTDGPGSPGVPIGGSGRGLAGLRERVEAVGGTFSAGPRDGGGFEVRALIPAAQPR